MPCFCEQGDYERSMINLESTAFRRLLDHHKKVEAELEQLRAILKTIQKSSANYPIKMPVETPCLDARALFDPRSPREEKIFQENKGLKDFGKHLFDSDGQG